MPHLTLEYSANVEQFCEISSMCSVVRESALGTGVFPLGGIRVRARRCDHYSIADGRLECAFIDVEIRIGEGRSLEVRKNCTETCLLYTSPSPRDQRGSRMPSSA